MVTLFEATAPPKKGHRDARRAFYTEDRALVAYMVDLLDPRPDDRCLEPCAGSGLFVDELIFRNPDSFIDAIEISSVAIEMLRQKFQNHSNVCITEGDYLSSSWSADQSARYDKIIANPPYGAWQTPTRRRELKDIFPDLYVKESATLFLAKAMALLNPGGRAVFILPETFLFAHSHRPLRKRILESCVVESIDVFPSSLFPNVNFGYARLSILALRKGQPAAGHLVVIRQAMSTSELITHGGITNAYEQDSIVRNQELSFPVNGICEMTTCSASTIQTLGDLADCVTGFYSGDDARFLKRANGNEKYVARYPAVAEPQVFRGETAPLSGLPGPDHFVPVLKGGGHAYLKPTMWYMNWSEVAVQHYKTNKKARFQNRTYYFQRGIGFPMVSSGKARASVILSSHLFDQSIVGIFPKDEANFGFLLAFLNSSSAWRLLRQINPSTNNSAKYMRRIPVVLPSPADLLWFTETVNDYLNRLSSGEDRNEAIEQALEARVNKVMVALSFFQT